MERSYRVSFIVERFYQARLTKAQAIRALREIGHESAISTSRQHVAEAIRTLRAQ